MPIMGHKSILRSTELSSRDIHWRVAASTPVRMQVIITVISLLSMNVHNCYSSSESGFSQLRRTVKAMDKLMTYLNQHDTFVMDLIFGVILARGQLNTLSRHLAMKFQQEQPLSQQHLWEWIAVCDNLYHDSSVILPIKERNISTLIFQKVINPSIWELDKNMTRGLLSEPTGHWKLGSSYWQSKPRTWLRASGHPKESQSDTCIAELTECKLSSKCWKMVTRNDKVTGYSLTHRLLYLQVARQLNCLQGTMLAEAEHNILKMCSNIIWETKNLYELGPSIGLSDLFIEQIVLCGIEGFAEFLKPEWLKMILKLQAPQGCFGEETSRRRRKRSDAVLDEDCTMHITGIAATALSLFLRAMLE